MMIAKIIYQLPIYTFQIDFMGHVNNSIYMQWMEIGRTKLLEAAHLSLDTVSTGGVIPVLASTTIQYLHPLYLGDTVEIELWISELRRASARLEFRFSNQDRIPVATATQLGLFYDLSSRRPHRLNREDREHLLPFLIKPGS